MSSSVGAQSLKIWDDKKAFAQKPKANSSSSQSVQLTSRLQGLRRDSDALRGLLAGLRWPSWAAGDWVGLVFSFLK